MIKKEFFFDYKYYIPKDKEKRLKEYKYNGGTDSLLNIYCWSPLA